MGSDSNHRSNELRQRAEELLKKRETLDPQEFAKNLEDIMENLQVYHIEFEMQNQELVRLQKKLSKSNTKFQALFNQAPIGYCILNLEGIVLEVNNAFASLVQQEQLQVVGKKMSTFIHPDDQNELYLYLLSAYKSTGLHGVTLRIKGTHLCKTVILKTSIIDNEDEGRVVLCSFSDISKQEAYHRELSVSEARFRSLISSMDDVVFTLDTQQRHTGVYGRWVQQNNQTPEDYLGKTSSAIFGDENARIHELYAAKALKGKNVVYEWSIPSPRGEQHFQTSLSPIYGENKVIEGVVGLGRNVTDIKHTMQALKESEEKYRYHMENVNDIIYTLSPEGCFKFVSPNWPNFLGHSIDEVMGHHFSEFVHPEDLEVCKLFLEKVIATGKRQSGVEYRVRHKEGHWHWHHSSGSVKLDADGAIEFIGVAYDVTEVKNTQEQLRERIKEIDCLYKITTLGNDTSVSLGDFLRKCLAIIPMGFMYPHQLAVRICHENNIYASAQFAGNFNVISSPLKTSALQGGKLEVELLDSNLHFLNEEQTLLNLLAETISQVIERSRVLGEINEANENLHAINAEKDKILTIIAHDLRGPLLTIVGLSEHMKEEYLGMDIEKQRMFIDGIHKTAKNLSQLLDNLLVWARLKRGNIEFKPKSNNLFQLAESAIVLFEDQLKKKQVHLSNGINKNLSVLVDAMMVETIFRNLISNAIKFSNRGGYIELSAKTHQADTVLVSITDNGVGMDDFILSHLFKFDNSAGREGTDEEPSTGFGMPLCKELVEKNNGEIWAESLEGKESTISFTLPLA